MSESPIPNLPFKTLGTHLKYLREQSNETLSEVSGAVEIGERDLERIEAGAERPAEDILLLLISHFDMQDQEAVQLWELAGYDGTMPDRMWADGAHQGNGNKSVVMLLALDMRTIYTDGLEVDCNKNGLTMNFSQTSGQDRPTPVARLGMSYDQAEQVLHTLQQALLRAKYLRGPKSLPPKASDSSAQSNS